MAKRLWLLFAQFVTLCLAIIFVISTLKPNWLGQLQFSNQIKSITLNEANPDPSSVSPGSYHEAVKVSMPAVVNVFSSKNENPNPKAKPNKPHGFPNIPKPNKPPAPNSQEEWFNFFQTTK